MTLRSLLRTGIAASTLFCSATFAQDYPAHPVRVISPYGPGGSNDISARIIAEGLSQRLGQQFVVENKPGAGTRVANEQVASATPDGYTLLYAAAPLAISEAAGITARYDIHKRFVPIGVCVVAPVFLVVNADSPIRTLDEFIRFAKGQKEGVTFASPGVGAAPHLTSELFAARAGFKVLNVQYRGDSTAYTELLAGRVDATITAITTALPYIKAGKLRVLAVASDQRSSVYPDAKTFAEQGFPGIVGYGWFGLMAPAGTPPAIVARLNRAVQDVLADSARRNRLLALGLQPQGGTGEAFGQFIGAEVGKWSQVIRTAGITLE